MRGTSVPLFYYINTYMTIKRDIAKQLPAVRGIRNLFTGSFDSEPQRSYLWEVSIIRDSSGDASLRNQVNNSASSYITGDGILRFLAKSVTVPQQSVEVIKTHYMGKPIHYSGMDNSSHSITMTFWDNEQLAVYRYLTEWMQTINQSYTGRAVGKKNYGRTIKIALRDSHDLVDTYNIELFNAFVVDIGDIPLNYETSDAIEITATFMFEGREDG